MEYPDRHNLFDAALVEALTGSDAKTIGEATLQAMHRSGDKNDLATWHPSWRYDHTPSAQAGFGGLA